MNLQQIALKTRQDVLKMAMSANGGHIAPSYSIVEILSVLYFRSILRYNPQIPLWEDRDYFILSKGHGVLALYSILSRAGYFTKDELMTFGKKDSKLGSLAKAHSIPGIEASTGSLGHGLSYATGIALAIKRDKKANRVYVLLGDGECEEGSIWEAIMFAVHNMLGNLIIILDYNGLQAMDSLRCIMSLYDFAAKFRSFGLNVIEIDGHNFSDIENALIESMRGIDVPTAIISHTIKGKGISFMENKPIWHYRIPNEEELKVALKELSMTMDDLGEYEHLSYRNII